MSKPELTKVKCGGSIYVQIPEVMKAITISDDSESNEELDKESMQGPIDTQLVVVTAGD